MQREHFSHAGLRFSYLDSGGSGPAIIALHARWMEAASFVGLAAALTPELRVVALDQRGHGWSDHANSYTREDYLGDLEALLGHLGMTAAILLGNSLGGVNAYQFASRHPGAVRALVIEDISVQIHEEPAFILQWAGVFPSRQDLVDRIGPRLAPYLLESIRETKEGWKLAFEQREMLESQRLVNGDHWQDWLTSACPALVIRGRHSRLTTSEALQEMAARRPRTRFVELDAGHAVHVDAPAAVAAEVRAFARTI
jgi:pimeloyl-ACP methyl ester carboxylesterase